MVQPLVAVSVTEASSSPQLHYGPHRLLNQRTRHALPSDARTPMNFTWLALASLTGTAVPLWIREYVSFSACRCLYTSTYSLNYRLEHCLLLWMFRSLKLFVTFARTKIFTLYNINFHFEIQATVGLCLKSLHVAPFDRWQTFVKNQEHVIQSLAELHNKNWFEQWCVS